MQVKKLRDMLNKKSIIRAPGAYDAWSARLVELAGFPAVYMTGYGASASIIGRPDIGLLTMTEMATQAKNMAAVLNVPLIADGDNGYGGVLNVVRTVREYAGAGVAAIQLEDQVLPKRCGHMEGKQLIPKAEMVSKIKAAVHVKNEKDIVIIARTDARAVNGYDDAIDRALAYAQAGADVIFLEAPQSLEEMEKAIKIIPKPMMANMVEHGKTPFLMGKQLEDLGYRIVIYPVSTIYAVTQAVNELLVSLRKADTTLEYSSHMVKFPDFNSMIGLDKERETENKFK
jgi:carboxyvinyl-carboxyphosphonate phosphorylmutase